MVAFPTGSHFTNGYDVSAASSKLMGRNDEKINLLPIITYDAWTLGNDAATVERVIPVHRAAFGQRLRELRQAAGWSTQEQFAHHIGVEQAYISGLETGRRNPTVDVLVRLARGLRVPPSTLLDTIPEDDNTDD